MLNKFKRWFLNRILSEFDFPKEIPNENRVKKLLLPMVDHDTGDMCAKLNCLPNGSRILNIETNKDMLMICVHHSSFPIIHDIRGQYWEAFHYNPIKKRFYLASLSHHENQN